MSALRRVTNIGPGRVVAVFIRKNPAKDQKLFAKCMIVRGKRAGGSVTDEGRGARNLSADAIQQAAFDASLRRRNPRQLLRGDHDAAGEVSIDELIGHSRLLKTVPRTG